jgi:phenolic acid decarboxylase
MYVKNDATIDYRIHSGHVGGRWAKGQQVDLVQLDEGSYKLSWTEPAGACVAVNILPAQCRTRHNSLSSAAINYSLRGGSTRAQPDEGDLCALRS